MPSFLQLPVDLPWWALLAILVPGAIYALLLLAMPFSVFGLKSRLDQIEGQLEDIQQELRALTGRIPPPAPPPGHRRVAQDGDPPRFRASEPELVRPERPIERAIERSRAEPRLDWPR